ncbi:Putative transposase (identified by ISEscan HMM) [Escherichia coli]|nr:Putative transposase (identified by ISEscan HMM) [Escherichia coli]
MLQLSPLEEALHGYVLTDGKLHADDTPVPVLLPGNKKTKTGRLWTYVRDDRNAGSTLAPAVWFAYSPDRKGIHPQTHLAGSVVYCRRMHTPGSTSCTGMAG